MAQALFAPKAVALIGASGDASKNTARPQRYLKKHGYAGKVFPVNPTRKEIFGARAYARASDIPEPVEHAYILIEDVEQALEDCGRRGVAVASVFSGGFSDAGPAGMERQAKLAARARALGVRLLGPNSMGVIDVPGRLAASVNAVLEMDALPAGTTSIVSQSGTMLGTLLSRGAARGLGFAKLVSVGNEADLGVGELVELLAEDAATRVILLFLETVRDAPRLAAAARKAHAAGKPIAAYKLGRSSLGEAAALSHTGALAGTDAALDAYFRDCGIVRVDMLEALLEIPPLLAGRSPMNLRKGRVTVVTTTGGGAASVVDRLGMRGVELAAPIMDLTMAGKRQRLQPGACPRRANGLRRGRGLRRLLGAVPSGGRSQTHYRVCERKATGRVFHAACRAFAGARRGAGNRGVPHAGSVRRRARRIPWLARAAPGAAAGATRRAAVFAFRRDGKPWHTGRAVGNRRGAAVLA